VPSQPRRQAAKASGQDDLITIWGAELGNVRGAPRVSRAEAAQVTLVAKLVDVKGSSTQMTYTLDDGSGRVDCKMWVDGEGGEAEAARVAQLRPGSYVRMFGALRHFAGAKSLVAYALRPVGDLNEVTFHALEVLLVNKQLTARGGGGGGGGGGYGGGAAAPPANAGYGGGGDGGAYRAPAAAAAAVTGNVATDVLAVFKTHPSARGAAGVSVAAVVESLGRYTAEAVRAAVEEAVNGGHLYSTTDDQHYKFIEY